MKKIYIAHPLRGTHCTKQGVEMNQYLVSAICKRISIEQPNLLILSPIHAFGFEAFDAPDDWVLGQCRELLSLADELWVFGDWQSSKGCNFEINAADELGITTIFMGSSNAYIETGINPNRDQEFLKRGV